MTCNGCPDDGQQCPYCGRTGIADHRIPRDIPTDLPMTGRTRRNDE